MRAQVSHIKTHGQVKFRRQQAEGWGAKVIDRLSADLRLDFPAMQGLLPRNLKYMRAFAAACPDRAIVQRAAAQIPWFHNCLLLDKVKDPAIREWHIFCASNFPCNFVSMKSPSDFLQFLMLTNYSIYG